jgi:hypothetical protein
MFFYCFSFPVKYSRQEAQKLPIFRRKRRTVTHVATEKMMPSKQQAGGAKITHFPS